MVEPNIFLILGDDEAAKDQKVLSIKKRFLAQSPGLGHFNIDDIDARGLTLKTLQEILKRLPFKSTARLLIIRSAQLLAQPVSQYFLKSLKQFSKSNLKIVFCAFPDDEKASNKLIVFLKDSDFVNTSYCRLRRRSRVFDLARDIIDSGNTLSSLSILKELLLDGKEPPAILGGLFWYWNNSRALASRRDIKKDLELFLDTDFKIKTGKVNSDFALELLVVKLCQRQRP